MSNEITHYKVIDNIPQKRDKASTKDVLIINEMIEGFDTVQNTLDNINRTNKYDLELNHEQVPIVITKNQVTDNKKSNYIVLLDNGNDDIIKEETIEYVTKNASPSKMDFTTSFYIGSLSILGLFILHRLIQKTK
jgi:polyphosphate kinase 2 (PPK2 family)